MRTRNKAQPFSCACSLSCSSSIFFSLVPFLFLRGSLSPSLAHNGTFCRGDLTCAFCSNSAANAQMRVALSRCRASKSAICCCNTESARCTSGTALLKVWRNSSCAFASCPWSPASARDVASTASSCELSSSRRAVSSRNRLDSALCMWYQKHVKFKFTICWDQRSARDISAYCSSPWFQVDHIGRYSQFAASHAGSASRRARRPGLANYEIERFPGRVVSATRASTFRG